MTLLELDTAAVEVEFAGRVITLKVRRFQGQHGISYVSCFWSRPNLAKVMAMGDISEAVTFALWLAAADDGHNEMINLRVRTERQPGVEFVFATGYGVRNDDEQ